MPKQYQTKQIATIIGVHPNTVRLYEDCGFITKPQRLENGYRVFTDLHIAQFRMARTALQIEVLQGGLRKQIIDIIKLSAQCDFSKAMSATLDYMNKVQTERKNAEEALEITKGLLSGISEELPQWSMDRKQTAQYLGVSIDTLRNWELNGLLCVKRKQNGYRIYRQDDIQRLKMIRSLRCANYSLSAILRMLNALSNNTEVDIRKVIDTPREDENIVTACDKLLTSLAAAESNSKQLLCQLKAMRDNDFKSTADGLANQSCHHLLFSPDGTSAKRTQLTGGKSLSLFRR